MGAIVAVVGLFGFGATSAFTWDWRWLILSVASVPLGAAVEYARKPKES